MERSITDTNFIPFKSQSSAVEENKSKNSIDETLIPNDKHWGEKLRDYKNSKKIFSYDSKVFPLHITNKMIMDSQREFNPITQKYYNEQRDKKFQQNTNIKRLEMISKGYDKQLEVESTYDIINLKNKLEHFNYEEPGPKPNAGFAINDNQFNFEKSNVKPYNIISNLSLRKHNFVKPELRPENDNDLIRSEEGLSFKKNNIINKADITKKYDRDYNIINNRYKIFNNEKMDTERKIQNLSAMKKMQNMRTYDIIRGKYLNPVLEKQLQEKEALELNKNKSKIKDKNYIVRNPINHIIYDEIEQKRLDDIDNDKKKRFLAGVYINDYYHSKSNNCESQKLLNHQNYFNPFEYKMQNKRGYNILTNAPQTVSEGNKYLSELQSKKLITDWGKLKNNSDKDNNTFKSKNLYKVSCDPNDIDVNYSNYLNARKPILNQRYNTIDNIDYKNKNRVPIKNKNSRNDRDRMGNQMISKSISKLYNNNIFNKYEDRIDYHIKYSDMDKDKFFGTPRAILKSSDKNRLFD